MIGITSYGAYIPRLRLNRMAIFQAMGWFAPAIIMVAQGERSMCNHDEDTLTMAVAAADFLDLMNGKLPAMQAYTSGKLKIGGDIMKSQLIEKLFKL